MRNRDWVEVERREAAAKLRESPYDIRVAPRGPTALEELHTRRTDEQLEVLLEGALADLRTGRRCRTPSSGLDELPEGFMTTPHPDVPGPVIEPKPSKPTPEPKPPKPRVPRTPSGKPFTPTKYAGIHLRHHTSRGVFNPLCVFCTGEREVPESKLRGPRINTRRNVHVRWHSDRGIVSPTCVHCTPGLAG